MLLMCGGTLNHFDQMLPQDCRLMAISGDLNLTMQVELNSLLARIIYKLKLLNTHAGIF